MPDTEDRAAFEAWAARTTPAKMPWSSFRIGSLEPHIPSPQGAMERIIRAILNIGLLFGLAARWHPKTRPPKRYK